MSCSLSCPTACMPHESSMRRPSPHRLILITTCYWSVRIISSLDPDSFEKRPYGHVAGSARVSSSSSFSPCNLGKRLYGNLKQHPFPGRLLTHNGQRSIHIGKCHHCVNQRFLLPLRTAIRDDRTRDQALLFEVLTWRVYNFTAAVSFWWLSPSQKK